MAEVLEIQIKDTGSAAAVAAAKAPPRPPAVPVSPPPAGRAASVGGAASPMQPSMPSAAKEKTSPPMPSAAKEKTSPPMPSAAKEKTSPPMPRPTAAVGEGAAAEGGEAVAAGEGAGLGELGASAGVAGGALASVAAVAAPVAIAFAAVYAAVEITEAAFNAAGQAAQAAGQQLSMMARNNYVGMFQSGLDTAAKALGKVPLVGGLLSSAMSAASASVQAFTSATAAFTERAHELAAYSPAIAMAEQRQAMRSMFDDIKEAQQMGPGLEQMLDAETNLQHDLREMFLPIKKVVVEVLAEFIEKARDWLPAAADALAVILKALEAMIQILDAISLHVLHELLGPLEKILTESVKTLRDIKKNTDKKEDLNDIFLLDLFQDRDWNFGDVSLPWGGADGDPRPHIPLVQAFAGL